MNLITLYIIVAIFTDHKTLLCLYKSETEK